MQWTKKSAHLVLQMRSQVLDERLEETFRHWYPDFRTKSLSRHLRYACAKFLRQSFHEFGGASIPYSAWAKAFYDSRRARNKGHHTAVRALAYKWIRILYACWKSRAPYNESLYPIPQKPSCPSRLILLNKSAFSHLQTTSDSLRAFVAGQFLALDHAHKVAGRLDLEQPMRQRSSPQHTQSLSSPSTAMISSPRGRCSDRALRLACSRFVRRFRPEETSDPFRHPARGL